MANKVSYGRPLHDNVLIRPINPEEKSPGGIVLPEVSKGKPSKGFVLAVGPGKWVGETRPALDTEVGMLVLFNKYGSNEVRVGDEELILIKESEIMMILES